MEELQLILTDPARQEEIRTAAQYSAELKLYTYSGYGFQVSGKTKDLLMSNLLRSIKMIIRR